MTLLAASDLVLPAGDSITDQGASTSASSSFLSGRGYWAWMMQYSGGMGRLLEAGEVGVSGDTSTQLLARYDTDVIAHSPKLVALLIGTNDLSDAADTPANISAMIAKNRAIGAKTLIGKLLPKLSTAAPMNSTQIANWEAINAHIASLAASDVKVWDAEPVIGNMDAEHTMLDGHSISDDHVHPNIICANKIGELIAPLYQAFFTEPDADIAAQTSADAGNLITNALMEGTSGTNAGAGQVADSWVGDLASSGGATVAFSKVARDDDLGEWQQVALSGTYSGTSRFVRVRQSAMQASLLAGDLVEAVMEIEVDAGLVGVRAVSLIVSMTGMSANGNGPASGDLAPDGPMRFIAKTLPFPMPDDGSGLTITVSGFIYLEDSVSSTPVACTARFARAVLRKVS